MRGKEERENKFTERRQQDLMQPQSKAGLNGRGRAIPCSPKQKNCRSQQAEGNKQQKQPVNNPQSF